MKKGKQGKKGKIETGMIFTIPLWNGRKALGKVLHASKIWENFLWVGVYKQYSDTYDIPHGLPIGPDAFFEPRYFIVSNDMRGEPWEIVGQVEIPESEVSLCNYIMYRCLYQQDTKIREAQPTDYTKYPGGTVSFCASVTSLANDMLAYWSGCDLAEIGLIPQPMPVQAGDVLAIPLRDGRFVPARVLYLSRYPFRYQKALLGIHKTAQPRPDMPARLTSDYHQPLRYVIASHLSDGRWSKVGHIPLGKEEAKLSLHVHAGRLFQGDCLLREATDDECAKLNRDSTVWEIGWVEKQVHEWFGCPPRVPAKPAPPTQEETDELWIKAAEWVAQLSRAKTWRPAEQAFAFALKVEYLELDECYEAIAAAEAVAAALGKPEKTFPPEAKAWAEKHRAGITPELVQLAATALERIQKDSELSHEIAGSEELKPWKKRLASLAKRLKR